MIKQDIKQDLEIAESIIKLAEFLKTEEKTIITNLSLFDKDIFNKLRTSYNNFVEFQDMDFEERAKVLGVGYKKVKNGYEVSKVL
jgi:hypothetical protein